MSSGSHQRAALLFSFLLLSIHPINAHRASEDSMHLDSELRRVEVAINNFATQAHASSNSNSSLVQEVDSDAALWPLWTDSCSTLSTKFTQLVTKLQSNSLGKWQELWLMKKLAKTVDRAQRHKSGACSWLQEPAVKVALTQLSVSGGNPCHQRALEMLSSGDGTDAKEDFQKALGVFMSEDQSACAPVEVELDEATEDEMQRMEEDMDEVTTEHDGDGQEALGLVEVQSHENTSLAISHVFCRGYGDECKMGCDERGFRLPKDAFCNFGCWPLMCFIFSIIMFAIFAVVFAIGIVAHLILALLSSIWCLIKAAVTYKKEDTTFKSRFMTCFAPKGKNRRN